MKKVLFVASLHHPEQLRAELAVLTPGAPRPLFPSSMGQHFWERAMRRRDMTVEVFWRNISGFRGEEDFSALKSQVYQNRFTVDKALTVLMRRLPAALNLDYRLRNARLAMKARHFRPDVLWLVGDNTIIYPDTLALIQQETGCKIMYASGTSPIVFSHAIERDAARLYDLVLVNDFYHGIQWLELGARQMECLPIAAVDPEFHFPLALSESEKAALSCDLSFVGTLVPDKLYSERVQALETLKEFDLGIWSVHEVPAALQKHRRGSALGAEMMRVLCASKITLNIHGNFMRYGGNMRLFEAAAVGAFQIVDNRPGVSKWFTPGEHLITFEDLPDLREKAAYYLNHPADRRIIAEAARAHVVEHHTYDQRLERVEALLAEISKK